jgi:hypothetical protein
MMDKEFFSYEKWVEEALRDVIKRALEQTVIHGLSGEHHFFITFLTNHDDVDIPAHLRAEHPAEMTIVLQHQFDNLSVTDDGFSVSLSFSGRSCFLSIPYAAITAFADPAVNFALQLKMAQYLADEETEGAAAKDTGPVAVEIPAAPKETEIQAAPEDDAQPAPDPVDDKMGEVIALDAFRKK